MVIDWPQAIYLVLFILGLGIIIPKLGKPKTGTYGWVDIFWAPAIVLSLLYWGGFFTTCN